MKRIFKFICIAAAVVMVAGCQKETTTEQPYLDFVNIPETGSFAVNCGDAVTVELDAYLIDEIQVAFAPEGWNVVVAEDSKSLTVTTGMDADGEYEVSIVGIGTDGKEYEAAVKFVVTGNGYADPRGVFVLNEGDDYGSLLYISPNGTVEENVYETVNGTHLGNVAQDMYVYNGLAYILCWNTWETGEIGDGKLIIADARTMKTVKTFDEELDELVNPSSIAVLDEANVFICDETGVHRLDSNTGEMHIIDGTWRMANGTFLAGNVYSRGMAVVGDRLYAAAGGWTSATDTHKFGLYEFVKNSNEVNRMLGISNRSEITGVCAGENGTVWVSTSIFTDEIAGTVTGANEIFKVNAEAMEVVESQEVRKGDITSCLFRTSAITADGDYIYFTGGTTKVYRHSFTTQRTEYLGDASEFEPMAKVLYNHIVVDPATHRLYMLTLKEKNLTDYTTNNILVFDVSGSELKLVYNFANYTCWPAGTICMSQFVK